MSYDIHITRASHWTESTEFPISLDELRLYFRLKMILSIRIHSQYLVHFKCQ